MQLNKYHLPFKKRTLIQDALSAVDAAKTYYKRIRSHLEFDRFYDASFQIAEQQGISKPELPRPRRCPVRLEEGAEPHQYQTARAYYRHVYFEACDLRCGELESRFERQHMPSVLAMEQNPLEGCKWRGLF